MQVNYIQVAYVLGIPAKAAKIRIAPFVDRLEEIKLDRRVKYINKDDYVESSKLKALYHHPSPDLNGKDQIAYIIQNLRGGGKSGTKEEDCRGYVLLESQQACRKIQRIKLHLTRK